MRAGFWNFHHPNGPAAFCDERGKRGARSPVRWALICFLILASFHDVSAQGQAETATPLEAMGSRGVRVHDPSTIVKCKDEYWLFYTGRGIPSYRSKDLLTWERGPIALNAAPPWVAAAVPGMRFPTHFWAPDVIHVKDRYLLYYSASTFGKNTSAIGLISNPTLDPADPQYKWTDEGIVIQSSSTDDFNAIDPALTLDADNKLWMSFGSFWSGIKMIELDPATGKRISPDSTLYSLANYKAIEAPFIHRHGKHYYLFFNWDTCCRGENSTYNIRVGRSEKITGPYLDKDGKDLLAGGGTLLLQTTGAFIGPGHPGIIRHDNRDHLSLHFYDGTRRGASTLAIRPLRWADDGWPIVDEAN